MFAAIGPDALRWPLFLIGAVIVLLPAGVGVHFMLKDPDRLQGERYELRQASLQMIQGREGPQVVDSMGLVANRPAGALSSAEFEAQR